MVGDAGRPLNHALLARMGQALSGGRAECECWSGLGGWSMPMVGAGLAELVNLGPEVSGI
jgi:hypothetical protein